MRTLNRKPKKPRKAQDPVMTQQKYDELQAELAALHKKRPQAAAEVSRLAEMGDFSENVEYQLAKRRLRGINYGILKLEDKLRYAEVIQTTGQTNIIEIGHTVTIDMDGQEKTYTILGSSETDPSSGIISHTSPLGKILLGKAVGESTTFGPHKKIITITAIKK